MHIIISTFWHICTSILNLSTPRQLSTLWFRYLRGHAASAPIVEHKGIRIQHAVFFGVGEAADQIGSGGCTGHTLEGREGSRDKYPVVAHGSFHRPSVFACNPGTEPISVYSRIAVHASPQLVLLGDGYHKAYKTKRRVTKGGGVVGINAIEAVAGWLTPSMCFILRDKLYYRLSR